MVHSHTHGSTSDHPIHWARIYDLSVGLLGHADGDCGRCSPTTCNCETVIGFSTWGAAAAAWRYCSPRE